MSAERQDFPYPCDPYPCDSLVRPTSPSVGRGNVTVRYEQI